MLKKLKFVVEIRWLIAAALVVAVALGGAIFSQKPVAPEVALPTLAGQPLSLKQWRGKVVLVNFWATSCTSCVTEMPRMAALYRELAPRGFETAAIAMDYDRPDYVLEYSKRMDLPFAVALDLKGEAAKAFGGVHLVPSTFLIDKQGRIVERYLGQLDFGRLRDRATDLLDASR